MNEPVPETRIPSGQDPAQGEDLGDVVVGRYRLVRLIGRGGMGAVYEAEHEQLGHRVAVKLLNTAITSPDQLRRFHDESHHLAKLRHPNIAHVIDAGTQRYPTLEVPYFAMEYVKDGRPITVFAEQEQLTIAQRLRLFQQACDAVLHAHAQGILHRDLKPGNILVDADGRPKLIDFGIARALERAAGEHALTLTQPSELLGTLQYMSPEQLAPHRMELDRRSDVYALGLVLYELVCARTPYQLAGTTHAEASRIVRDLPVPRPRSLNARLSRDVETVILKSLRKDRDARYATVAELAEDVRRVLSGEAILARGEGRLYRGTAGARRAAGRHPVALALAVGCVAFLIALAIGSWLERFEATGRVECLLTTHVPFAPAGPLKHVRIVALGDDAEVARLAAREGLKGVDPDVPPSLRRLHARLMEKLAGCGARVVAWDFAFTSANPQIDPELVRAIARLRSSGTDVALVVPHWRLDAAGRPLLTPAISAGVPWGSAIVQFYPDLTWTLNLAMQNHAHQRVPSLALAAAAAYWQPLAPWSFEFGLRDLEVRHRGPGESTERRAVPVTFVDEWFAAQPSIGVEGGEPVAQFYLQIPSDADLRASTLGYANVLAAPPRRLAEWFSGRAVIVGNFAGAREPPRGHPDGRLLPGVVGHAVGLDWLIQGRAIRRPPPLRVWNFYLSTRFAVELLVALAAVALTLLLARSPKLLLLVTIGVSLALVVFSMILFASKGVLFAPHGALIALVLVVGGTWVAGRWAREAAAY